MNKTLIISLVFILNTCISLPLKSQSEKGKFLIGGNYNLNFSSNKRTFKSSVNNYEMEKNRSIEFSPFIGYLVLKNLSPGIKLNYMYFKKLTPDGMGSYNCNSSNSLLIIPSVRYYFLNSQVNPFLQAGYGFGWEKEIQSYYQTTNLKHNNKLAQWELWGGVSFLIKSNLSFELGFGYNSLTVYYKDKLEIGGYNKWQNVVKGPDTSIGITLFL